MPGFRGSMAQGLSLYGQKYRSASHGMDKTNHRNHLLHQWAHNPDGCIPPTSLAIRASALGRHQFEDREDSRLCGENKSVRLDTSLGAELIGAYLTDSACLISSSVRCRMKTGFPRHLMMTFLPSGMAARSISTLAWANTSADADMLTRKSVGKPLSALHFFCGDRFLNAETPIFESSKLFKTHLEQ